MAFKKISSAITLPVFAMAEKTLPKMIEWLKLLLLSIDARDRDISAWINGMAVTEAELTLADNTTGDVSTARHGFAPKAPNDTTKFLRGDAAWDVPAHGSLSGITPAWTVVSSFSNSWVDSGATYYSARYMKDPHGIVRLAGRIKDGTIGSAAFTLPTGYRPAYTLQFAVLSNNDIGKIQVNSDGEVTPASPAVNTWVQLDNVAFFAG